MNIPALTLTIALTMLPPPEYDPKFVGEPDYVEIGLNHADLKEICADSVPDPARMDIDYVVWACTDTWSSIIYIDESLTGEVLDIIRRHEIAHLLGWRHE